MADYYDQKVVESNDLVQYSRWSMRLTGIKVFDALVSCIDTQNPPKDNKIYIDKEVLYHYIGATDYRQMKDQLKQLQKTVIELKLQDGTVRSLTVCPTVDYPPREEDRPIVVEFHRDMMPYIVELKERFVQYPVRFISRFHSVYGLTLYKYFLSKVRQIQGAKDWQPNYKTGCEILNEAIQDLRHVTGTDKKYHNTNDFMKKVIYPAIKDINQAGVEYLIDVIYRRINGKKVYRLTFTIRKRTQHEETEFDDIRHPERLVEKI